MSKHKNPTEYIDACAPPVAALLRELRAFIHAEMPGTTEAMQYGVPVFLNAHEAPVIYLFGAKDHVNFGFLRYDQLSGADDLEGSGKPSKHVKIYPDDAIEKSFLQRFIAQCVDIRPAAAD